MDSKSITRKDFILLTFTLVGTTAAACGSSNNNAAVDGGHGGTGGGAGGSGGAGGGAGGAGGVTDAGADVPAGDGGMCLDPLPEAQTGVSDHVHTVTLPAAMLSSTTDLTINTSIAMSSVIPAHMHAVTFTVANLAVLKAGGTVTVTSTLAQSHLHMYVVSCTGVTDAGGQ